MPLIIPNASALETSDKFIPALIVVDMQTDFVTGSLAVPDASSIIEPTNSILSLPFALKVGTKDYHPAHHISFASNHNKSIGDKITIYRPDTETQIDGIEQVLWPDHCVQLTPGAEFAEGFNGSALDAVVYKGTHPEIECYSAFGDPWGVTNASMELPRLLEEKEVTDVFVTGIAGDYCVKSTAIDASRFRVKRKEGVEKGIRVWVVRDLVRSVGNEGKEWDEMQEAGIGVVESGEVRERLENKAL